ncbi:MAG TPA: ABC transporter substrate-binding protein [Sphingomonas sp.]|jgi:peptide/nickel transport system substrate-binding protein|nr:ABC transporter substrate-binding protein [Sphingomonas sp.]
MLAALMASGCNRRPDVGPVLVSAIGKTPAIIDTSRRPADTASRVFADATAQGLVRFDAVGQIEPGLAQRWTVIDDGMSYIFRLREAQWADGSPVTAEQVVAALKRQVRAASRNPLAPFLTAVDEIVVMTPQVIEVRLSSPRPDLLKLFAQPELALVRPGTRVGSGPMKVVERGVSPLLRPVADLGRAEPDDRREALPEDDVRLIGESAARAIARFAMGKLDLIVGGTFADWPIMKLAKFAPANIRIDPAAGLFGLAVVDRSGFLSDATHRLAVARAIDRVAVTAAVTPDWEPADRILPESLDSAAPPARLDAPAPARGWAPGSVMLRIAMPQSPGATLVFGQVAASLRRIGVVAQRVPIDSPADLKLIDAVAPYDSARWYLATACQPCGAQAQAALEDARLAPTRVTRAAAIARADRALANDIAFIPIARPLRWSVVSLRLRAWQPNTRAWHPLNRLRQDAT